MKKTIFLLSAILLGIAVTTWYSCETDPEETCEQDEICEAKFVTACCTDNECVYKYNGKEYSEDQVGQLAKDLGCDAVNEEMESESQKKALASVVDQLKALMAKTREQVKSAK
jgi:hypothetical protein